VELRSPYDRDIARLAVPALGTLVAEPLYVLADTAIVGHLGTAELGGLALASTVLLSVHGLMIFLAYGTTAAVARLIGAGDEAGGARISVQGFWLAALLGIGFAAVIAVFAVPLLRLLGGTGDALEAGRVYLVVSLAGLPFLLLTLAGTGAFHGRQDARTPLVVAGLSATANLVLEVVLIYGFGFGIGASALATVVAQAGAGLLYGMRALGWARSLGVGLRPDPRLLLDLLVAGQPLVLRTLALRGSFTLATAVAARIGLVEVASFQIAIQVWSTLSLALDAVAIAGQALTGRWLGAGEARRAREAATRMIELDVAVAAAAGLVILVARHPIAGLFSSDPGVVATAATMLIWVALAQPINGYVFALDGILIGAGDYRYLGRSMALVAALFTPLALAVLWTGAGLSWLWATLVGFMALRAAVMWWRWRSDRWIVLGATVRAGRGQPSGPGAG
jgi:putative MATE family efflux protein